MAIIYIDEVAFGGRLGSGGSCNVFAIAEFDLNHGRIRASDGEPPHSARNLAAESRYAIKVIQPKIRVNEYAFAVAAHDLRMEVSALKRLRHPNIVKLHGYSKCCSTTCESDLNGNDCYFLVIERLEETLADRIRSWRQEMKRLAKKPSLFRRANARATERALLVERLQAAFEIASALEYIHAEGMIFRDLKPSNIGFDTEGVCKVFDFGLARPLPETMELNDTFQMSGRTGTMRYMAPEVFRHEPYNAKADVYSFAHVLWEILAVEQPYRQFTLGSYKSRVVTKGERPKMDCSWAPELQDLLNRAWSPKIKERPTMEQVCCVLKDQIAITKRSSQ